MAQVAMTLHKEYPRGIENFNPFLGIPQELKTKYRTGSPEIQALTYCGMLTTHRYSTNRRDAVENFAFNWDKTYGGHHEFPAPRGFTIVAMCTMKDPKWIPVGDHLLDLAVYLEDPLAAMWVCFLNLHNKTNRQRFRSSTHARASLAQLSEQGSDWRAMILEAQQRLFERKSEHEPAMTLLEQAIERTKPGDRPAELDREEPVGAPWSLNVVDMPWKALYTTALQRNLKEVAKRAILIGSDKFDDPEAWAKRVEDGGDNETRPDSRQWLDLKSKIAMSVIPETEETAEAAWKVGLDHLEKERWLSAQAHEKRKTSRDLEGSQGFDWINVASQLCHVAKSRYNVVLYAAVLLREWGLIKEGKALLDEIKLVLATEYDEDQQAEEYLKQLETYLDQWDPNQPNRGYVPPSADIRATCWGG